MRPSRPAAWRMARRQPPRKTSPHDMAQAAGGPGDADRVLARGTRRPASAADPGRPGVAECDAGAALALVAQRLCSSAPLGQDGYAQVLAVTATGDVDHVH